MVTTTINRLATSKRFLVFGALFLAAWYGYLYLPSLWAAFWPPFRSYSVEIHVEGGIPVSVVERRDIYAAFDGTWRVRVIDLTRNEVRCYLPPMGPKDLRYRPTETRSLELSWRDYTDDDGSCLRAMQAHCGTYETETHRRAWVFWRWVDLPTVRSLLSFEIPCRGNSGEGDG